MEFCVCNQIKTSFTRPYSAALIMLAGIGALTVAFVAQYLFDDAPCALCLWQRVPYAAVIPLGGAALLLRKNEAAYKFMLLLCALTFLSNVGIAGFHTGVERLWWEGTDGCELTPLNLEEGKSLTDQLLNTATVRCDQIYWTILGMTMANWNMLASLVLAAFALISASGKVKADDCAKCCCRR